MGIRSEEQSEKSITAAQSPLLDAIGGVIYSAYISSPEALAKSASDAVRILQDRWASEGEKYVLKKVFDYIIEERYR